MTIIAGQRFGLLTAKDRIKRQWRCWCDCGQIVLVWPQNLATGATSSCGCAKRRSERAADDPLYPIWASMKVRAKAGAFPLAKEFVEFRSFRLTMGIDYFPGARFCRRDQTKGFNPENCEWR